MDNDSPPVPCIDGIYYGWMPVAGNPSCLILHRWVPEHDKWLQLDNITCVPSAEWGTNTLRN